MGPIFQHETQVLTVETNKKSTFNFVNRIYMIHFDIDLQINYTCSDH